MLTKPIALFRKVILAPIQANPAMALFVAGIVIVLTGTIGEDFFAQLGVPRTMSTALVNLGSAILGAGVFAIIMKSTQFTELFQQHIADVFYSPEAAVSGASLMQRWSEITNAILRGVLPSNYGTAATSIAGRFFNSKLEYHFESFEVSYDIHIDDGKAMVTNTLKSLLVLSPNKVNHVFEQKIKSDTPSTLSCLLINDVMIRLDDPRLFIDNGTERILRLELKPYVSGAKSVKLERTFVTIQDTHNEPYIAATISRFIKGAIIKARITDGYKIRFLAMGIEDYGQSATKDGQGYCRWILAGPSDLLLPGDGYTLVFVPKSTS